MLHQECYLLLKELVDVSDVNAFKNLLVLTIVVVGSM
jgi:hypothetical protein